MRTRGLTQRGFTLIELLVALVIGGLLAGMVLSIFKSQSENHELQEEYVALEQNLRGAMEVITKDLRMTGLNLPAPIDAMATGTLDLQGEDTPIVESNNDAKRNGADAMVTRKATDNGLPIRAHTVNTTITVCHPSNLQTGQLLILVDNGQSEWRSINIKSVAVNGDGNVQCSGSGNNADQITFDDNLKAFNSNNGANVSFNGGTVFPLTINSYYIDPDINSDGKPDFDGDGVADDPALMMVQNFGTPVVLAFGITDLQVIYFEDIDNNNITPPVPTTAPINIGRVQMVSIALTGQTRHRHKIGRDDTTPSFRTRTLTTRITFRNTL